MKAKILATIIVVCLGMISIPFNENAEGADFTYNMDLKKDIWNLKSYPNQTATYSPVLYNAISYCKALVGKNATSDYWYTYWPSVGLSENFTINPGDGLFVLVTQDTPWNVTVGSGYTRGDLFVDGNLSVAGNSSMDYNVTVNGTLTIQGNFEVNTLTVTGDLDAQGNLTVNDDLTVGNNLTVNGFLTVAENITVGNLSVTNDAIIGGDLTVIGSMVYDDLSVNGNLTVGINITGGNLTISGDADIGGTLTVGDFTVIDLTITSDLVIGGNLSVAQNAFIDGDLTVNGTLSYDDLTITGNLTVGNNITGGNLSITGDISVGNNLTVDGDLTVSGDLNYDNLALTGNLTVGGDIIGATGRTATYVVVANNAPQIWKNQADWLCDGTADDMQIQYALDNCSSNSGIVQLSEGNFDITTTINMSWGKTLQGTGSSQTILEWTGSTEDFIIVNGLGVTQSTAKGGGIYKLRLIGEYNNGVGVRVRNMYGFELSEFAIWRSGGDAVVLEACMDILIHDCYIAWGDAGGIVTKYYDGDACTLIDIANTEITAYVTYGIHAETGLLKVTNCYFEGYSPGGRNAMHVFADYAGSGGYTSITLTGCTIGGGAVSYMAMVDNGASITMRGSSIKAGAGSGYHCVNVTDGRFNSYGSSFTNFDTAVDVTGDCDIAVYDSSFSTSGSTYGNYAINITDPTASAIIEGNYVNTGGLVYSVAPRTKVIGNTIVSSYTDYAIYIDASYSMVQDNHIENARRHGILFDDGNIGINIEGNYIFQASYGYDDTYNGIEVRSSYAIISGNSIISYTSNRPRYGINLTNEDFCVVTSNCIRGTRTADIYGSSGNSANVVTDNYVDGTISIVSGTGNIIKDNVGFVTENYGYNTSVSNSDTIPHGLDVTPTIVIITPTTNTTVWVTAITSTTFTVGLPTGTYNLYWYAIYKP